MTRKSPNQNNTSTGSTSTHRNNPSSSSARIRHLVSLAAKFVRRHYEEPAAPSSSQTDEEPPPLSGFHARALTYLRIIPGLLLLLFAISFVWDFPGWTLQIASLSYSLDGLLRTLAVGGLIGFGTNWLAVTMLFRPRQPHPILGQGLLPAQRKRIAHRLGQTISDELINETIIARSIEERNLLGRYRESGLTTVRAMLEDAEFRHTIHELLRSAVDDLVASPEVRGRLIEIALDQIEDYSGGTVDTLALKFYRYLREDDLTHQLDHAIRQLPDAVDALEEDVDEVLDQLPEKLEENAEQIEDAVTRTVVHFVGQLDVQAMLTQNIERFEEARLERLLRNTTDEQLQYIKYLGGILGTVGGLVIWEPVPALICLTLFTGAIYGADLFLLKVASSSASDLPNVP